MSVAAAVEVATGEIIDTRTVVLPVGTAADAVDAMHRYQELCAALLDDSDFQTIGERRFPKKSAWRKLALAYGVDLVIVSKDYERDDNGRIMRAEFVAAAIAPNGRRAESFGACDLAERKFTKAGHDIPATAETRAKNRACADLFGMGEVSAEEVDDDTPPPTKAPPTPNNPRVSRDELGFLLAAIDALSDQAVQWLEGTSNADPIKIPNIKGPDFRRSHRDRLAWHIIVAQRIKPAGPDVADADEPVPAHVHDDTEPA